MTHWSHILRAVATSQVALRLLAWSFELVILRVKSLRNLFRFTILSRPLFVLLLIYEYAMGFGFLTWATIGNCLTFFPLFNADRNQITLRVHACKWSLFEWANRVTLLAGTSPVFSRTFEFTLLFRSLLRVDLSLMVRFRSTWVDSLLVMTWMFHSVFLNRTSLRYRSRLGNSSAIVSFIFFAHLLLLFMVLRGFLRFLSTFFNVIWLIHGWTYL